MADLYEQRGCGCLEEAAALLSRKGVGRRWADAGGSVHPRALNKVLTRPSQTHRPIQSFKGKSQRSSLEKCLFNPLSIFQLSYCYSYFLILSCRCSLYVMDADPHQICGVKYILCHSVGSPFTLWIVFSYAVWKTLLSWSPTCLLLLLVLLVSYPRIVAETNVSKLSPCFPLGAL